MDRNDLIIFETTLEKSTIQKGRECHNDLKH